MDYAWGFQNSEGRTHPVGDLKPNAWGLHDMHGNVWEWCVDTFDDDYYSKLSPEDPVNTALGPERVIRGGSWNLAPDNLRASFRGGAWPDFRSPFIGFRVVFEENDKRNE